MQKVSCPESHQLVQYPTPLLDYHFLCNMPTFALHVTASIVSAVNSWPSDVELYFILLSLRAPAGPEHSHASQQQLLPQPASIQPSILKTATSALTSQLSGMSPIVSPRAAASNATLSAMQSSTDKATTSSPHNKHAALRDSSLAVRHAGSHISSPHSIASFLSSKPHKHDLYTLLYLLHVDSPSPARKKQQKTNSLGLPTLPRVKRTRARLSRRSPTEFLQNRQLYMTQSAASNANLEQTSWNYQGDHGSAGIRVACRSAVTKLAGWLSAGWHRMCRVILHFGKKVCKHQLSFALIGAERTSFS